MKNPSYFYATALICNNGHLLCSNLERHPEQKNRFCPHCSAPAISQCPHCSAPIHGDLIRKSSTEVLTSFETPFISDTPSYTCVKHCHVPAYCPNCGQPFPWTETLLTQADRIIDLVDDLTEEQKCQLKQCFPNLITDTPESQYSALLADKLMRCMNQLAIDALKNLLINYISAPLLVLLRWK